MAALVELQRKQIAKMAAAMRAMEKKLGRDAEHDSLTAAEDNGSFTKKVKSAAFSASTKTLGGALCGAHPAGASPSDPAPPRPMLGALGRALSGKLPSPPKPMLGQVGRAASGKLPSPPKPMLGQVGRAASGKLPSAPPRPMLGQAGRQASGKLPSAPPRPMLGQAGRQASGKLPSAPPRPMLGQATPGVGPNGRQLTRQNSILNALSNDTPLKTYERSRRVLIGMSAPCSSSPCRRSQ